MSQVGIFFFFFFFERTECNTTHFAFTHSLTHSHSFFFLVCTGLETLTEDNLSAIRSLFNRSLHCQIGKDISVATERDFYLSLAYTVRDHVMAGWHRTQAEYYRTDPKVCIWEIICFVCVCDAVQWGQARMPSTIGQIDSGQCVYERVRAQNTEERQNNTPRVFHVC